MAVYKPSQHIPLSKALAAIGFPLDARSYFYDETLFVYRPYISTAEVNSYLANNFRVGSFDIVINFGGSLSGGVITGGENKLYWYDIGFTDSDLKPKGGSTPAPQDLQSVTEVGATTDRATTYTDFIGVDYLIDGLHLQIDPEEGSENGGLLRTKGGVVINGVFFSPASTNFLFQEDGEDATEFTLNTQTSLIAGLRLLTTRMQCAEAINSNEAVTLGQLNNAVFGGFQYINKAGTDLVSNGDGTFYLPVDIDDEVVIIEIQYKIAADTKTFRVDVSQAVHDSSWSPPTRIYGFANNDAQTIRVTKHTPLSE
jgi:hypothetical protein